MGDCVYCGQSAGFLRSKHKECQLKEDARIERVKAACDVLRKKVSVQCLSAEFTSDQIRELMKTASDSGVDGPEIKAAIVEGWESAVNNALDDNLLSDEEESRLMRLTDLTGYTQHDLDQHGAWRRLGQAAILRDLAEGRMPRRISFSGAPPQFALQRDEDYIWVQAGIIYFEHKTRKEYVGRSTGVSFRIARGVYLRQSAFRGHPIEYEEMVQVGTGVLAITNKHIYFQCDAKSVRVPFKKIVSFKPYSDGFAIFKEGVTARQQTFGNGDGWFLYNLVCNVPNIDRM